MYVYAVKALYPLPLPDQCLQDPFFMFCFIFRCSIFYFSVFFLPGEEPPFLVFAPTTTTLCVDTLLDIRAGNVGFFLIG